MFRPAHSSVIASAALLTALVTAGACTVTTNDTSGSGGGAGSGGTSPVTNTTFGQVVAADLGFNATCAACIDDMTGQSATGTIACGSVSAACENDSSCYGAGTASLLGCLASSHTSNPTRDPSCYYSQCVGSDATSAQLYQCVVDKCSAVCGDVTNTKLPTDTTCVGTVVPGTIGATVATNLGLSADCGSCIDTMSGNDTSNMFNCGAVQAACQNDTSCDGTADNTVLGCLADEHATNLGRDASCFFEDCVGNDDAGSQLVACIVDKCAARCGGLTNDKEATDPACQGVGGAGGAGGAGGSGGSGPVMIGGTGGAATYVRFANLVPDTTAVDVCFRPCSDDNCVAGTFSDTTVTGPLFQRSGFTGALSNGIVSSYFGADAGTYQVRFVASGSTSCVTPINTVSQDAIIELGAEGNFLTVLAWGPLANGLIPASYVSDADSSNDGQVHYNFVNGFTGALQTADFGTYDPNNNNTFTAVSANVAAVSADEPSTSGQTAASANIGFAAVYSSNQAIAVSTTATFATTANQSYDIFTCGTGAGADKIIVCLDTTTDFATGSSVVSNSCRDGAGNALP